MSVKLLLFSCMFKALCSNFSLSRCFYYVIANYNEAIFLPFNFIHVKENHFDYIKKPLGGLPQNFQRSRVQREVLPQVSSKRRLYLRKYLVRAYIISTVTNPADFSYAFDTSHNTSEMSTSLGKPFYSIKKCIHRDD